MLIEVLRRPLRHGRTLRLLNCCGCAWVAFGCGGEFERRVADRRDVPEREDVRVAWNHNPQIRDLRNNPQTIFRAQNAFVATD